MEPPARRRTTALAWGVHAFTASGTIIALLAINAIWAERWTEALLWLLAALIVDGLDGSLARMAKVEVRASRIDGAALDLIVDYLNYVFVPTLFLWRAGLIPPDYAVPLAALIQLAAVYAFARKDMKTEDNYFRGFPGLWNIALFYLWVARPGPEAGAILVLILAALTFAPVHVIHPFRVRDYGRWPLVLASLWAIATAALLWPGWSETVRTSWLALSGAAALILIALGLLRTVRGPRAVSPPESS